MRRTASLSGTSRSMTCSPRSRTTRTDRAEVQRQVANPISNDGADHRLVEPGWNRSRSTGNPPCDRTGALRPSRDVEAALPTLHPKRYDRKTLGCERERRAATDPTGSPLRASRDGRVSRDAVREGTHPGCVRCSRRPAGASGRRDSNRMASPRDSRSASACCPRARQLTWKSMAQGVNPASTRSPTSDRPGRAPNAYGEAPSPGTRSTSRCP